MARLFSKAPSRTSISRVFQSLERKMYNVAQERMVDNLPALAAILRDHALDALHDSGKSSMTGNTINGYGIAIYRNGKCVAVATTHDVEDSDPIQVTLAEGDVFKRGRARYDGTVQQKNFKADMGQRRIWAQQEVVAWLNRYPPRVVKGRGRSSLAYRVVCIVDYAKVVGGREAMLWFMDDVEKSGALITTYSLG